jgi:glycerol uptake facilitator-like aquaporin
VRRRATAEFVGTAFLLIAIVGSGIMAERLSGGNVAVALLANALATGGALIAVILAFGPISGAHLNPVVSLVQALRHEMPWSAAGIYGFFQCAGAVAGVAIANSMFGFAPYSASHHARSGGAMLVSEFVATFGLVVTILGCIRWNRNATPFAVGAYIAAAYWFTPSTSFANPAVTLARSFTDTFSGIRQFDVLPFVAAQILGALAAAELYSWLTRPIKEDTDEAHGAQTVRPVRLPS